MQSWGVLLKAVLKSLLILMNTAKRKSMQTLDCTMTSRYYMFFVLYVLQISKNSHTSIVHFLLIITRYHLTIVTIAWPGQQIMTTMLRTPKVTTLPKKMLKEMTISNTTINLTPNYVRLRTTTSLLVVGDANAWRIKESPVRLTLPLGNIGMDWKSFSYSFGGLLVRGRPICSR